MTPQKLTGFLATIPLLLTRLSKSLLFALKAQAVEICRFVIRLIIDTFREFLRLVRLFFTGLWWAIKWLSTSYIRIETSVLGTAVDMALVIFAMRYLAIFVLFGVALFMWNIWAFVAYGLFILVASIRFFRSSEIDFEKDVEDHIDLRNNFISWLRWPLRLLASITLIIFTSSATLLSNYLIMARPVFDYFSITPFLELSSEKEPKQAKLEEKNRHEFGTNSNADTASGLKTEAKNMGEPPISTQAKMQPKSYAAPKEKEEEAQNFPSHETTVRPSLPTHDSIILKNDCDTNAIYAAVHYAPSSKAGNWVTKGWWKIPAHATVTLDIQSYGERIDVYGKAVDGDWNGNNQSDSILIPILENKNFVHYDGLEYYGRNIRHVLFFKLRTGKPNGTGKPYGDVITAFTCRQRE